LPPSDCHGDQPDPGWNVRWWIALSVPRIATSSMVVPRRLIAAGAVVACPCSVVQPDQPPARSTFCHTAPSVPTANTWTASPYAAAAGPEMAWPPIDAHGVHVPPATWRSQIAPSAPRATKTMSPGPRDAAAGWSS
jgi:hypothetical protein